MTDYTKDMLYYSENKGLGSEKFNYKFSPIKERKRILYGVCGEGMGHAIRSGVVIKHLLEKNDVTTFAHGRAYHYLRKKFNNVYQIEGFNTVYESNKVNSTKTLLNGIKDLPQDLMNNLTAMYDIAKTFAPHIIISDFEFYSNLLSKILRVPLISLDHTHVVTHCENKVPIKYLKDKLKAEGVVRSFIQLPTIYLITSFFYPPLTNPERVKIFPPILRKEIFELKPENEEHILVYQTSDSNLKLIELLKEFDYNFIIYGFYKEEIDGNLSFRNFNEVGFFDVLASSKAVITNGGFNVISEAIYLNKPIFSMPVKKQFEQILNAIHLEKLGYGEFHDDPDKADLEKFLLNLDIYKKNIQSNFVHDGNHAILQELDVLIEELTTKSSQINTVNKAKIT